MEFYEDEEHFLSSQQNLVSMYLNFFITFASNARLVLPALCHPLLILLYNYFDPLLLPVSVCMHSIICPLVHLFPPTIHHAASH